MNLREVKICTNDQDRRGQFFKLFLDVVPQHLQTRILNIFHRMKLISEDDQFDYRRFILLPIDKFKMQLACGETVAKLIEQLKEACASKFGPVTEFNNEDIHDHRTVALAARAPGASLARFSTTGEVSDRYLFSINLKHRMVTFPIGKCRPNEGLVDGLVREMQEELGLFLQTEHFSDGPYCKFTKPYWFTGQLVKVETNVFCAAGSYGNWICSHAKNNEPMKCGGIFFATFEDAMNIATTCGLKIADCVMFYKQFRSERQF